MSNAHLSNLNSNNSLPRRKRKRKTRQMNLLNFSLLPLPHLLVAFCLATTLIAATTSSTPSSYSITGLGSLMDSTTMGVGTSSSYPRGGGSTSTKSATPPSSTASASASTSSTATSTDTTNDNNLLIRVAYQGEPGAYSEKATRELLGPKVTAIGRPNFESCFKAVANMEVDYACLPIENSLGGSIHENYDLMLRYDLTIVAEHEFRVKHCLLAKPGVKQQDIKYAISHPQALAQCDNFLRGLGITPIPTYDTAGSAKMIAENNNLPEGCTPENTAAIASDLAGRTYGLDALHVGIEDDDTNFTRFLLLARRGVAEYLTKTIPAKTSVVFTLPNTAGALYKAMACFSLRDIDMSKIESRPTSASLLNFLKFKSQQLGKKSRNQADLPRFRYCFYMDILAHQLDETTQNALAHLREQADFVRILGSYPQKSKLVGPVAKSVEQLKHATIDPSLVSLLSLPSDDQDAQPLKIGIIGLNAFGQFMAKRLKRTHQVSCMDPIDRSSEAQKLGIDYYPQYETSKFLADLDVVIVAVGLVDFEDTVQSLPVASLRGKLVVEMCVLNAHPKAVLLRAFGNTPEIDLVSSHPMFGPDRFASAASNIIVSSGSSKTSSSSPGSSSGTIAITNDSESDNPYADASTSWEGRPFVYEKVRVSNIPRWETFLKVFEQARCRLVEMNAEQHDASIADAEFVTHLTGRLLTDKQLLPPTPVISKEYAALCDVADMVAGDSFDLFFGMFKYNDRARLHMQKLRDNLATLERQLAAKEAYLEARLEMRNSDRQRLLAETRLLLQEVAKNGGLFAEGNAIATSDNTDQKKDESSEKGSSEKPK